MSVIVTKEINLREVIGDSSIVSKEHVRDFTRLIEFRTTDKVIVLVDRNVLTFNMSWFVKLANSIGYLDFLKIQYIVDNDLNDCQERYMLLYSDFLNFINLLSGPVTGLVFHNIPQYYNLRYLKISDILKFTNPMYVENIPSYNFEDIVLGLLTNRYSSTEKFKAEIELDGGNKFINEIYVTNGTIKLNQKAYVAYLDYTTEFETILPIYPGMFESSTDKHKNINLTWVKVNG